MKSEDSQFQTDLSSSMLCLATYAIAWILVMLAPPVLIPSIAKAQSLNCEGSFKDIPIEAKVASAGFFANFRNRPGSVSFESEEIFHRAQSQVHDLKFPRNDCPKGCRYRSIPFMYFHSKPQSYLSKYSDSAHCKKLEKETIESPILYENESINSIEDLTTWIGELTQGKGSQGKDLYRRCDKSCSPRYEYHITKLKREDHYYKVTVSIICGEARDKDQDMYELKSYFRWVCEAAL